MEFTSSVADRIHAVREEIAELLHQERQEYGAFLARLRSEGWREFTFSSEYYGSHPEYGEGDELRRFLFHPSIDCSVWDVAAFAHGHLHENESNRKFSEWLDALPSDHWHEIER